jgi:hypothetical protein
MCVTHDFLLLFARSPMKKPTNPIAITTQPLAGRQLPADWQRTAADIGGNFDKRDISQLWKSPNWSSKLSGDTVGNIVRSSRLAAPSGA